MSYFFIAETYPPVLQIATKDVPNLLAVFLNASLYAGTKD